MVDTIIEHFGHPGRPSDSCNLTQLGPANKTRDIRQYLKSEHDFPLSFHYFVEIYNDKFNRYFTLNDDYLDCYKPFGSPGAMADAQPHVSMKNPIRLKVTWMNINETHDGERRLEPATQIVSLPDPSKLSRSKL